MHVTKYYAAVDEKGKELAVVSSGENDIEGAKANLKYAFYTGIIDKIIQVDRYGIYAKDNSLITTVPSINKEIALQKAKSCVLRKIPEYAKLLKD